MEDKLNNTLVSLAHTHTHTQCSQLLLTSTYRQDNDATGPHAASSAAPRAISQLADQQTEAVVSRRRGLLCIVSEDAGRDGI